jgi:AAA-like domain/Calcineurin-like phosphoesterase
MAAIGWLHLTDLHHGMAEATTLLPAVRQQLFQDLQRLYEVAGPWDLVLFTGDLTQTGRAEDFDGLSDVLQRLWEHLEKMGSRPALLAVPGNHDLRRPKPSPTVKALYRWHEDREIQAEFWRDPESPYRAAIGEAFAPYVAWSEQWRRAHPVPAGSAVTIRPGVLPGDFAATVEKDGIRLGIAGLNSAFLQLTGDSYEGRLHLDHRQLHEACGGDSPDWIERHQVNLLMTHHPPEWLHVSALAQFKAEIDPPGWFEAHLFGHMHEPTADFRQISGAPMKRRLQGASLFGRETWGEGQHTRIHGYSAGRITIEGGKGSLSVWPRIMTVVHSGSRKLVPDYSFDLDFNGSFHAPLAVRTPTFPTVRPAPTLKSPPHRSTLPPASGGSATPPLPDPGGPYDARWYVPPQGAARDGLSRLRQPGHPVAIWGPELFGKTWLLKHLLRRASAESASNRVVLVHLRLMGSECLASIDRFLAEFAAQVLDELELDPGLLAPAWARSGTPLRKITWLFNAHVLPAVQGTLVIAIDRADSLWQHPWCRDFLGLLRDWSEESADGGGLWERLRLAVTMSTTPALLARMTPGSPFDNVSSQIRLVDLSAEQVTKLAELHGLGAAADDPCLRWTGSEVTSLMDLVGGHPFLARLVMVKAARDRAPLSALLDPESPVFDAFLNRVRWRLAKYPALLEAFRAIVQGGHKPVDVEALQRLDRAGLVRQSEGGTTLRYRLYERLLHLPKGSTE